MTGLPPPPAHIETYVDILGVEGTVDFLLTFGGAELALSTDPARGRLARHVGRERAAQLAAHAGHLPRRVPLAKPWIAQVLRSQGLPVSQIARRLHVSDVAVRGYLKRATSGPRSAPDSDQFDLFG